MSGLEIDALRLTEAEIPDRIVYRGVYRQGAEAQLAKAVEGFRVWLRAVKEDTDTVGAAYYEWLAQTLEQAQALEQANIKRPADIPSKAPSYHPR